MTAEYDSIRAHQRAIEQVVPLLEAIRSVAEIAFRRAEERLLPLAQYAEQIDAQLASLPQPPAALLPGLAGRSALILVASERGLCGGFNRGLVEAVRRDLAKTRAAGEEVDLLCLGRRGQRLLEALREPVVYAASLASLALPTYLDVERVAVEILDLMETRGYSRLVVTHNAPLQRFRYQIVSRQLFPVEAGRTTSARPAPVKPSADLANLLTQLVSERVLVDLYRAVVESAISEELARVAAMRLAADNARGLADELAQAANRTRQVAETSALQEIVAGYRATAERR